jgi:2'-5' RNA ligase
LGAVAANRRGEVTALVDHAARGRAAFEVRLGRGGGRERGRDGVAWLELAAGAGEVIDLAGELWAGCPGDISAGAPPRRTPSAHLTVARRIDRAVIAALRDQRQGPLEGTWTVERVVLFRSHLGRGGSVYEELHEAKLVT